jgi:hypothetical protein
MTMEENLSQTDAAAGGGEGEGGMQGVMAAAQDATVRARTAAAGVAERLPDAMATAQGALGDTAQTLQGMPEQTLMLGASFSLGLGLGMFMSGTNRLLVTLALMPAAAMAATLFQRENSPKLPATTSRPRAGG